MGFFSRFRQQPQPTPKVEGLLGDHELGDWWLQALTAKEREEVESMWGYLVPNQRPLTRGHVASNPLSATEFLMVMSQRAPKSVTKRAILPKVRELRGGDLPGYIKGTHYSVYMKQAKQLVQDGNVQEADSLVDTAFTGLEEAERIGGEASLTNYVGVPPALYRDFAVLYRKLKDYAREVAILERFDQQPHAPGVMLRSCQSD